MKWFRRLIGWDKPLDMTGSAPRSYIDGMSFNGSIPVAEDVEEDEQSSEVDYPDNEDYLTAEEVRVMDEYGEVSTVPIYDGDFSDLTNYEYCKQCDLYYPRPVPKKPEKNYVSTGRAIKINGEYKEIFRDLKMPKTEDICDLRCPRDCECWEDRHPHVMAAHETPTGPKGNTDLDECDCLSCGVETITSKEELDNGQHRLMPDRVADITGEPKSKWIRIARILGYGDKLSNEFYVELGDKLVACKFKDIFKDEFRPLHRFYSGKVAGYTEHVVTTTGEFEAILKIAEDGCLVDVHVDAKQVKEFHLPRNHVFFKYLHVYVPVSEVL